MLRGLRWRPSPGRRGSARPLQRHMLKGSTASTGGQHRDTHFQGVLTTPAAPGGPGCSQVHVSQHGTTLRSHGPQTAATSSVSSFRPLCSLGWGTVACPAVLSLAGPSRTPSRRIARMHRPRSSPHCAGSQPGSPRSPSPPTRAFRRRHTGFPASLLTSGRGLCEYPCCVFLSRSWTGVVSLPSILRICPGPPLLAASHSDLTGATRNPRWFFILCVF